MLTRHFALALTACTLAFLRAFAADTLCLDLTQAIRMAQEQSPAAQSARHVFLAAQWQYKYYRANYLPSVTLTSSPYLNNEINNITQSDGTGLFLKQNQMGADLSLKVNQNVAFTGGTLFVKSSLNRLQEFSHSRTSYSVQPLTVGYQQNLFGHNSLKWDRRIEPLRYREARKNYVEAMELVAAHASNRFFECVTAQANLAMARLNLASADTLYRMAQGRYAIGNINENEVLQLEIKRLTEETNCMDAEVSLQEVLQSLRSYLGLEKETPLLLVMPDSVPQLQIPLELAMQLAMENGSDCDYYERQRVESRSRLAQAKANAGLRADLYVQFGLSQTGPTLHDGYRHPNHQEYVSVSFALPLLDWGRGKGQVRVAKSNLDLTETSVEQGMNDFRQNVQKLVMQFNMQGRKVSIAARTSQQAEHRYDIARRLYVLGRSTILDLNAAISEKDAARRSYIHSLRTYWSLFYTLRSITGYDFARGTLIGES